MVQHKSQKQLIQNRTKPRVTLSQFPLDFFPPNKIKHKREEKKNSIKRNVHRARDHLASIAFCLLHRFNFAVIFFSSSCLTVFGVFSLRSVSIHLSLKQTIKKNCFYFHLLNVFRWASQLHALRSCVNCTFEIPRHWDKRIIFQDFSSRSLWFWLRNSGWISSKKSKVFRRLKPNHEFYFFSSFLNFIRSLELCICFMSIACGIKISLCRNYVDFVLIVFILLANRLHYIFLLYFSFFFFAFSFVFHGTTFQNYFNTFNCSLTPRSIQQISPFVSNFCRVTKGNNKNYIILSMLESTGDHFVDSPNISFFSIYCMETIIRIHFVLFADILMSQSIFHVAISFVVSSKKQNIIQTV